MFLPSLLLLVLSSLFDAGVLPWPWSVEVEGVLNILKSIEWRVINTSNEIVEDELENRDGETAEMFWELMSHASKVVMHLPHKHDEER